MSVVSSVVAAPKSGYTSLAPSRPGAPCVFKGIAGLYHAGSGGVGVVICAPWGFEDLATRKSWRLLAEAVAGAGYPCLRFDYPATGNSAGAMAEIGDLAPWTRSVGDAADFLRAYSGVKRFVFIGQALGAALAVDAAARRADVDGLLLMAPVVRGKAYLDDLATAAGQAAERFAIAPDIEAGLGVLGFTFSPGMVDSLRRLDLTRIVPNGVAHAIVFDRPDRHAGADLSEHLRRNGVKTALEPVVYPRLLVADSVQNQPLPASIEQIVAALARLYPITAAAPAPRVPLLPATLRADAFREEPLRFGAAGRLVGVFCHPARPRPGVPTYLFLNRGLCPQTGWRRGVVEQARALAAAGFASLRFDAAGIGESPDDPEQVLRHPFAGSIQDDIGAAIEAMTAKGCRRVALVGLGSGAYQALAVAAADPRVSEVVAINAPRLVWNPAECPEDVARYHLRELRDIVGDVSSLAALARLARRRRVVAPAVGFFAKRRLRRLAAWGPARLRRLFAPGGVSARASALLADLSTRGMGVSLVYGAGDPGLRELDASFGRDGRHLPDGCALTILPDADHNLTSTRDQAWLTRHLLALGDDAPPRPEPLAPVVAYGDAFVLA